MKSILAFSLAIVLFLLSCFAHADTHFQISGDYWQVPESTLRYQPNYSTINPWHPTFLSGKIASEYEVGNGFDVAFKARYNQIDGAYFDQASIGYHDVGYGVRLGILPYRITWCETYDFNSVWAREPDAYCSFRKLADSASGAMGAQVYKTLILKDWAIDTQLSFFKPTILNQSNTQGGIYVSTGVDTFDQRYGASVNAMHLPTATQFRLGFISTTQEINGTNPRRFKYDTYFIGAEYNPIDSLTLKATQLMYVGGQYATTSSLISYVSSSRTISAVYEITDKDKIGLAFSTVINRTRYPQQNYTLQPLDVPSTNLSYRHDFDRGVFVITEYIKSSSYYLPLNAKVAQVSSASSLGFKIGFNY